MGGSSSTTTVQKADPWAPAQGDLRYILNQARASHNQGLLSPNVYQGQRVAGFGQDTTQARDQMRGIADGQGAGLATARDTLLGMAQGQDGIYRDLDQVKASTMESVMPSVMAAFGGSGMTDSSTARQEAATAAARAIAPIEYGAYNQAMDRSMSAANAIPGMMQAQYMPAQMLGSLGSQADAMSQQQINADMARFAEDNNKRLNGLNNYTDIVSRIAGQGGSQSSTSPGPSAGAQLAGAGLGGLGTYGALAANPITAPFAIGGGILAGLGSLF